LFAIITVIMFSSCAAQKKGFVNLITKNSLDGWHNYGETEAGNGWTVENDVLYFNPKAKSPEKHGDLVTNVDYGDFHLKYDWKISKNGNSGLMFYVNDDIKKYAKPYLTGPEMQVLDNEGHPDAKIFKHRAGDLYDLIPCSKETAKPAGEWNKAEIIANKGKLEFYLNGERVVETIMWDEAWNKMIAGSKFKAMPGFGKYKTGKIVLQDHGDEVWYKNIRIKAL